MNGKFIFGFIVGIIIGIAGYFVTIWILPHLSKLTWLFT